jgi:hypothetical protein
MFGQILTENSNFISKEMHTNLMYGFFRFQFIPQLRNGKYGQQPEVDGVI